MKMSDLGGGLLYGIGVLIFSKFWLTIYENYGMLLL